MNTKKRYRGFIRLDDGINKVDIPYTSFLWDSISTETTNEILGLFTNKEVSVYGLDGSELNIFSDSKIIIQNIDSIKKIIDVVKNKYKNNEKDALEHLSDGQTIFVNGDLVDYIKNETDVSEWWYYLEPLGIDSLRCIFEMGHSNVYLDNIIVKTDTNDVLKHNLINKEFTKKEVLQTLYKHIDESLDIDISTYEPSTRIELCLTFIIGQSFKNIEVSFTKTNVLELGNLGIDIKSEITNRIFKEFINYSLNYRTYTIVV